MSDRRMLTAGAVLWSEEIIGLVRVRGDGSVCWATVVGEPVSCRADRVALIGHDTEEVAVDIIVFVGRILFVLLFLSSALGHFTNADSMAGYARSKGVPAAKAGVIVSGILFGLGGLSVLFGIWPDLGALLLFLTLLPTAIMMHAFWKERDLQNRQVEQIQFLKDLSLAGAALALFGLFVHYGDDLGLTMTDPLFS